MATAPCSSSSLSSCLILKGSYTSHGRRNHGLFISIPRPHQIWPRVPISLFIVPAARRRNSDPAGIPSKKKKTKNKEKLPQNDDIEGDSIDADAIEALFDQLEEDLKNDLPSDEGDDEMTEEDLAMLEQELLEAFGSTDELSGTFDSSGENADSDNAEAEDEDKDEDEDEDKEDKEEDENEEEMPLKLKNWQLRRLASAFKIGRRKTSIKNLAAELCLDRAVVLQLLRDPPPNLLLMSAALPDKVVPTTSVPETEPVELSTESTEDVLEPEPEAKLPVHVRQSRWSMQKRLKKVQIETLERVYMRSKRPTNAMISSIVHVTNLPRKRVVQWFEEKRGEEGVPLHRVPYQRSTPEAVLTN